MVNEKFETIREPGKFGNHAASRIYYVHGRFLRKKKEVMQQKRQQQKPMWPRSVCMKEAAVSPHIYIHAARNQIMKSTKSVVKNEQRRSLVSRKYT